MRKTLLSLELLEDIPIDETCVVIHNPDEIISNDLMEMGSQSNNINKISEGITEAQDTIEVLESMKNIISNSVINSIGAKVLNTAIEHLCSRLGYKKYSPIALENFGGTASKAEGTKKLVLAIEGIINSAWEAIKAAFIKMKEWITNFFKWVFNSNDKQLTSIRKSKEAVQKHEEKIKDKKSVKEAYVEKDISLPIDESYMAYLGNGDIKNGINGFLTDVIYLVNYIDVIYSDSLKEAIHIAKNIDRLGKVQYMNSLIEIVEKIKESSIKINDSDLMTTFNLDRNYISKNKIFTFPFNKLAIAVSKDIDKLDPNNDNVKVFYKFFNIESIWNGTHMYQNFSNFKALSTAESFEILNTIERSIKELDTENSLIKGLKLFDEYVYLDYKNLAEKDETIIPFCQWVSSVYRSLIVLISDLISYTKITAKKIQDYVNASIIAREKDFKEWLDNKN